MSDLFSLADIDTPLRGPDREPNDLEFELRYRDGTSIGGFIVDTCDAFDDEVDSIVDEEIDLRLAQPHPPDCEHLSDFRRPTPLWEVEDDWRAFESEFGNNCPENENDCRCIGPCYSSPHDVVDPERRDAIWELARCTGPAIIATWRWTRIGTGGSDTIFTTSYDRQSFVDLWRWLPSEEGENA